ncbi:putative bifunctional diguanylate cyclase/phosphodiesterase [Clostridium sp. UBA1652]|uniref:putative bifunctional diguanylate cyclase/phosphodiesterase n=1 Tax=Clostridium sp. UBA1652 TaxID=1946348 RepID=UPI00257A1DAC|nr:bifunctional diguanylate cyclase/phosphodiesterase [Clostridium sp. UBA1652]
MGRINFRSAFIGFCILFSIIITYIYKNSMLNSILMIVILGFVFFEIYKLLVKKTYNLNNEKDHYYYRFKTTLDSLNAMLIEVYESNKVLYISEIIKKEWLISEDINYKTLLSMFSDEYKEALQYVLDDYILYKKQEEFSLFSELYTKDNKKKYLSIKGKGQKNSHGEYNISVVIFDITHEKEQETKIEYIKLHDEITGLPNRHLFKQKANSIIMEIKDTYENIALIFIDIDNFKYINDAFGSEIGNKVLRKIGSLLKENGDADSFASRYAGDEFIILKRNILDLNLLNTYLKKLIEDLGNCIRVGDKEIYTTISMGVALYPKDGEDLETLLKRVDVAMYSAKNEGKNTYRYFNMDILNSINRQYLIEKGLRNAIKNKELYLVMQPKVRSNDESIEGFECLVRWNSEELGVVSPAEFIPIAESSSIIIELGKYIIKEAMERCRTMINETNKKFKLSINLSEVQLRDESLLEFINLEASKWDIDPSYIEFEITETVLIQSAERNVTILERLKERGFSIALDDFGTGYSSLNYLNILPIDILKIDRSFIVGIGVDKKSEYIIRTIINLSHDLEIKVVAEGVETKEQLEFLKDCKCDIIQGYFFSKPQMYNKALFMLREGVVGVAE